jgi:hypothetical protein
MIHLAPFAQVKDGFNPFDLVVPDDDARAVADALVLRQGTESGDHQDVHTVITANSRD